MKSVQSVQSVVENKTVVSPQTSAIRHLKKSVPPRLSTCINFALVNEAMAKRGLGCSKSNDIPFLQKRYTVSSETIYCFFSSDILLIKQHRKSASKLSHGVRQSFQGGCVKAFKGQKITNTDFSDRTDFLKGDMNVEWIPKERLMEIADRVSANPDILEPHVTKEDLEALDITIDIIR